MERLIFNSATGEFTSYASIRPDGSQIVGLDPSLEIYKLIREPQPQYDPSQGRYAAYQDVDSATKTVTLRWQWVPASPPIVLPPQPQWVAFGAFLVGDAQMNQFVVAVSQSAPILDRMITVGLGQAAQGDAQTFAAAWSAARQLGMVSPELIAHMQKAAANFDLPAEFIAGLAAPLQPPAQP